MRSFKQNGSTILSYALPLTSNSNISHWNNVVERELHKDVALEYASYYAVRVSSKGLEEMAASRIASNEWFHPASNKVF